MKALILDDEEAGRMELRRLLAQHVDLNIVAEADDVASALDMTRTRKPDVAFLDVQLRGETAFDYVGQLREHRPRVVFVTAHDRFAVRGFECNAIDYLLKPVLPRRLAKTLERIRQDIAPERKKPHAGDSVFLPIQSSAKLVPWKDVAWIHAEGNYTAVALEDGQHTLVLRTMKQWEALFPDGMFTRINRSVFIRVQAVAEICPAEGRRRKVILRSGDEFWVSRNHWPALKADILRLHPEAKSCLS